jgi:hypothetical protein
MGMESVIRQLLAHPLHFAISCVVVLISFTTCVPVQFSFKQSAKLDIC